MFDNSYRLLDNSRHMSKEASIFVRVTDEMEGHLKAIASERGESLSLVAREALREYIANHPRPMKLKDAPVSSAKVEIAAEQVVNYLVKKVRKRK